MDPSRALCYIYFWRVKGGFSRALPRGVVGRALGRKVALGGSASVRLAGENYREAGVPFGAPRYSPVVPTVGLTEAQTTHAFWLGDPV